MEEKPGRRCRGLFRRSVFALSVRRLVPGGRRGDDDDDVTTVVRRGTTALRVRLVFGVRVAHRVRQLFAYVAYALPDGLGQRGRGGRLLLRGGRRAIDRVARRRHRRRGGGRQLVARLVDGYGARVRDGDDLRRPVQVAAGGGRRVRRHDQPLRVQLDRVVVTGRRQVHHGRVVRRLLVHPHGRLQRYHVNVIDRLLRTDGNDRF